MSLLYNAAALSKGWKKYYIMHKNRRVATIREDGSCTVYYPSFMPYNLWLEKAGENDIDTRLNNLTNFYYWCSSRVLTLDRKYAKQILNAIGATQNTTDKMRALISISYHALCLTDVYWVEGEGENLKFEDISLYRHSLSGAFADVSLAGKSLTLANSRLLTENDVAGDVSTVGVAPKAWIRKDSGFCLLKDGDERDVKAELLASRIVACFNCEHVDYVPAEFDGRAVSECRIITDEDTSIVPVEYIDVYCINHGINREEFVLKKDAYSFYMMNIIDYLIGNSDRHWGNWGFFVDNKNNGITRLYPLMDFNKAFTDYTTVEGGICRTVQAVKTQQEAAAEAVRKIGLNMIKPVDESLFESDEIRKMFFRRLSFLENI